jgi:hypothetical protein
VLEAAAAGLVPGGQEQSVLLNIFSSFTPPSALTNCLSA